MAYRREVGTRTPTRVIRDKRVCSTGKDMDCSKHYSLEKGTDFRGFHTSVEQGQWYEDEFLLLSSLTQDRYFWGCVVQKKIDKCN